MKQSLAVVLVCFQIAVISASGRVPDTSQKSRADTVQDYSRSLVIAPGAADVKYLRYADGRQQVAYTMKVDFPADDTLSFLKSELKKQGWEPLRRNFFDPGAPSSIDRGWTFVEDHTQKPTTGAYGWSADWENGSHDIVSYLLRYDSPDRSTRNLRNLQFLVVYTPAELAAKMKHDFDNLRGTKR